MSRKVKEEDVVGLIFNKWTVLGIDEAKSKNHTHVFCKCSCEKETIKSIRFSCLKRGESMSCGCSRRIAEENVLGLVFSKLTIIGIDKENTEKHGTTHVLVRCSCDKKTIFSVVFYSLRSGNTKSCGCIRYIKSEELINKKIGKLTMLKIDIEKTDKENRTYGLFKCECGEEKIILVNSVKSGHTSSCGCEMNPQTHGLSNHPIYKAWNQQYDRCNNPENINYKYYGGRGIKCIWTLEEACAWYDENPRPTPEHTIDRIDPKKHYELSNIRWGDYILQATNTTRSKESVGIKQTYNNRYIALIRIDKQDYTKTFDTFEEAKNWRDKKLEYRTKLYEERNSF